MRHKMEVALLYYISLYYYDVTHLYHRWCSQVQVGTSSCIVRCQAVGRAHTVTPTLGPCCSSTQIWSHCSCWWTTAGTSSAEPLCNSSPFGCLKEGQQLEKRSVQGLDMGKKSLWVAEAASDSSRAFQCDTKCSSEWGSYQYIQFQWSLAQNRRCTHNGSFPPCWHSARSYRCQAWRGTHSNLLERMKRVKRFIHPVTLTDNSWRLRWILQID